MAEGVREPTTTVLVPMRDGTRLATDVYLPDRPGRVPAVLARTPYGARGNPVWFPAIGRLFADNGMAFVAQDTRGHYASEGVAEPFECEASDGFDTCEWIERQPWSNGTLATFGESYVGYTALATVSSGHPAIRAAALRATSTDIAGDWLRHQGVLRLEFVVRWALAAWSGRDNIAPDLDWSLRPLGAIVPAAAPDRVPAILDAWARGAGHGRPRGRDATWPSLIDKLRVPAHFTAGWWDLFGRGEMRDWARHVRLGHHMSRLAIEATDHAGHDWSDGPTLDPLADFQALAARMPTVLGAEVAFLRRHLLGVDVPDTGPVTWMLTHDGQQTAPSWPPPEAEPLCLYLADAGQAHRGPEGGSLTVRPDTIPMEARWRHDPRNLVPSLEGEAVEGWFRQPDERLTQVRDDVLTFTSDAAREPLDLAGPVRAELEVRAPAAGGHVMAKLCDVYPTGEARRIVDGARLLGGGSRSVATVDLGHTGYRLRPGHRLRLEVSSSAFPRYTWHPGTSADPWDAVRTRVVDLGLGTGPSGSSITLTVLPRRLGS
jgi:putative CocE/NonD family hydrolase